MARIVKLVLDTAEFHPLHRAWLRLSEALARELGVELEVRREDYVYAIEHGETDELGMASLPQLFAETEDGRVELVLGKYPFNPETTEPDESMALELARKRLRAIMG